MTIKNHQSVTDNSNCYHESVITTSESDNVMCRMFYTAVASLGWVTPGAATECVTPLFFPEKPSDLFLVAISAVSPLISSSQKLTTFFAHRFIAFYCFHWGVTPSRVSPYTFFYLSDLVSPLFFVNLRTKNCVSFGCHPPGGCHPGRSAPLAPA